MLWSSPDVRDGLCTPESKMYGIILELSSFDPFALVSKEAEENKVKVVEQFKSPPYLIPAKMKEPSPVQEEPNHTEPISLQMEAGVIPPVIHR